MSCLVCGREGGWLSGAKLRNGRLCRDCAGQLPSLALQRGRRLQEYTLKNLMQKTSDNLGRFSATASYGALHIDEIHGLFCIAKSLKPSGKPVKGNNVFSVYDLTEVGLTCSSPRELRDLVYVDVEFRFSLVNVDCFFTETVKRNCRCKVKQLDRNNCTWEEPSDFLMFQSMFNQMLSGAWQKVNDLLSGMTVLGFELEKARTLFLLPEVYTKDNLMDSYSRLKKAFGECALAGGDNRELDIINRYYYLLQTNLELSDVE